MRRKTWSKPSAADLGPPGDEPLPPDPQRLGVVGAEVVPADHPQPGSPGEAVLDRGDRRDKPAGEDVLLDPGVGVPAGQQAVVRHRDRLQGGPPAGCEQPVELGEVSVPVALADRLDHLDRADGVELAGDVPVVAQLHRDPPGEPGLGHAAGRQFALPGRDRDGANRGAALAGPDRQLAPAGANLKQPGTPAPRAHGRAAGRPCVAAPRRAPARPPPSPRRPWS